jgi:nucleoside-diphosphate-sugar epimerase
LHDVPLLTKSAGTNIVDFTYAENAAEAFVLAMQQLRSGCADGKAYFITNGEPVPTLL